MKKQSRIITFFSFLILLSLVFNIPLFASNQTDSLNDPDSDKFKTNESDLVIVLYNGYYSIAFAEKTNVVDMIKGNWMSEKTYMVVCQDPEDYYTSYKVCRDGKISTVSPRFRWDQFYEYAVTPSIVLGDNVDVKAVYCLDGTENHNGAYIYYSTNYGDYVLYKEFLSSKDTYLFPLEDFYEYMKKIQSAKDSSSSNALDESGAGLEAMPDISKYNIKNWDGIPTQSWNFIWIYGSIGISILLIAIVCFYVVYRKKQKS